MSIFNKIRSNNDKHCKYSLIVELNYDFEDVVNTIHSIDKSIKQGVVIREHYSNNYRFASDDISVLSKFVKELDRLLEIRNKVTYEVNLEQHRALFKLLKSMEVPFEVDYDFNKIGKGWHTLSKKDADKFEEVLSTLLEIKRIK